MRFKLAIQRQAMPNLLWWRLALKTLCGRHKSAATSHHFPPPPHSDLIRTEIIISSCASFFSPPSYFDFGHNLLVSRGCAPRFSVFHIFGSSHSCKYYCHFSCNTCTAAIIILINAVTFQWADVSQNVSFFPCNVLVTLNLSRLASSVYFCGSCKDIVFLGYHITKQYWK